MEKTQKLEFDIRGMTCDNCTKHVSEAFKSVAGVEDVAISDWGSGKAIVTVEDDTSIEAMSAAVAQAGYGAKIKSSSAVPEKDSRQDEEREAENKKWDFDLIVIGAGSAGFAAAIKAEEMGLRVAIVGDGALGGTCVNIGCLPSKTLIRAAQAWHNAGQHPFLGADTAQNKLDWNRLRQQKDALVTQMRQSKYVDVLAAYPNIRYIAGRAQFVEEGGLLIGDKLLRARRYVIATGARPALPDMAGAKEVGALSSTTLMELEALPKSLIILGGRAIALELGQMLARLGVDVRILQRSSRLVPSHEAELGRSIKTYLEEEGIQVVTDVQVEKLELDGETRVVHAKVQGEEQSFRAEQILMALGRTANTAGMGLEKVGVALDERGVIQVNEFQQSSNPAIFAAGDVSSVPQFVYVAAASGTIAAQNALSETQKALDLSVVPSVIFTDPQIATVGYTEAQARAEGFAVMSSTIELKHVARAQAARDLRGFIKLVAEEGSQRLLGAHILAAEAGEVIQTATLAIKFGLSLDDLRATLFPYLTQVEGLKLAALAFEKDVAMLSCCAG